LCGPEWYIAGFNPRGEESPAVNLRRGDDMNEQEMYDELVKALNNFESWRARMAGDCQSTHARRILAMLDNNLFDVKHNVKMLARHLRKGA
jgi:hypothetical protein